MNTRATVFFVALLVSTCAAQASGKTYDKMFRIAGRADVQVQSDDAKVRVTGTDDAQVSINVDYDGYDLGKTLRIEARQDGDKVTLTVRTIGHIGISLHRRPLPIVEVRMPREGELNVETGDGSVVVSSLKGKVNVRTGDGSVKASDLVGTVQLRTSDGTIVAGALKGDVRLRSSDGSIDATGLDGVCDAGTSDGHIKLTGRFDVLNIKSGDGGIDATLERDSRMSKDWDIRSADGAIEVRIPEGFKALLDASSSDGHIKLDVPVTVEGEVSHSHVRGTMNGGGPVLTIHSSDGSIRLKKA